MEIVDIREKSVWEKFFLDIQEKTFLQSWNWGEFQKTMGNKIWRLGIYDNDKLIGMALVTKLIAKRGTFLLIQHGPVGNGLESLTKELRKIAKEEKASFVRIAPLYERNKENEKLFQNLGWRQSPMHANAYEATLKLNLAVSEEELLTNMRKTTRYLILQAEKSSDIDILQSQKLEDVDVINNLLKEVVRYQHFTPVSLEYLKNEFLAFQPDNQISLFLGKYKGEVVAGAFVLFWSNIGFYHQAALLPKYHKIPVSYFLQWQAIKEAKRRGCDLYDFWGYVDPQKYPNHPWAGPTLFKMGFGGEAHSYVKTQDLPLSLKYWPTYIFERLRKAKRRL